MYSIGHPAYSGANAFTVCRTWLDTYRELRKRRVTSTAIKTCRQQINNGQLYLTVWTKNQMDVIEIHAGIGAAVAATWAAARDKQRTS